MLRLYRSLIRSKLDYGCFIYGSATKGKLRLLDTVHHSGIRLATGAFRTSRIESLYAESGEPCLSLRRDILLCSYTTRLASQPLHPTHRIVLKPDLIHRYERNSTISRPVGIRYKELLSSYNIVPPQVARLSLGDIPPWRLLRATFNTSLCKYLKKDTPPQTYNLLFNELLSHYPSSTITIYTDGSSINGATGSAFFTKDHTENLRLPNESSVYTAELYAILRALVYIESHTPGNFLICSDSLSAIQSIDSFVTTDPLITNIQALLSSLITREYHLGFAWIPGHAGLLGNEIADRAAELPDIQDLKLSRADAQRFLRSALLSTWKQSWERTTSNKLRLIKDSIAPWKSSLRTCRREEVILTRLRIGHTRTTHGYLLRGDPPPLCPSCGITLTVFHFLLECPLYNDERRMVDLSCTLQDILGDDPDSATRLLQFLRLTGLAKSI